MEFEMGLSYLIIAYYKKKLKIIKIQEHLIKQKLRNNTNKKGN